MKPIPFIDLGYQTRQVEKNIHSRWKKIIKDSSFVMGNTLEDFELEFTKYTNSKYGIGVGNGGDAIELLLRSLNLDKNALIYLPANTFFATAAAVSRAGHKIKFVDVDLHTGHIDIEKLLTYKIKEIDCILPVHLFGSMVDVKTIKSNISPLISIIEDSAQAHGAKFNNQSPGTHSIGATYSFYPGKNLGAFGDGGIITTNLKSITQKLKKLRNYGSTIKYQHDIIGFNSRLDPIQAVVLSEKLKWLDSWNEDRRDNFTRYLKNLEDVQEVKFLNTNNINGSVYHLTVARVRKRKDLINFLNKNNISTIIHYPIPLHKTKAYKNYSYKAGELKNSEILGREILTLPNYPGMTKKQIDFVCSKVKEFYN
jgi:dTDP-4-amino-4,6-dideoxygalactose transaminase